MRRVVYFITVSLDGYFSTPDGNVPAALGPSDEEHRYANDLIRDADALVYGRGMHDVMSYWDTVDVDDSATREVEREFARYYQAKPRYVASRTLTATDGRTTILGDDLIGRIAALKDADGSYLLLGCGPELLALLLEAGVIDEVRLLVRPVLLAEGVRLFSAMRIERILTLAGSRRFDSGAVLLTYTVEPA